MKPTVYIDGQAGTTGLQIVQRLEARQDLTLLTIDPDKRHDAQARREMLNSADLVFLCLPDDAAREAVSLVDHPGVKIIDASTAHRVHPAWAYGFSELSEGHRSAIAASKRVANPGCHATGFISTVYPLVRAGLIDPEQVLSCFSLTGYSGGGKQMIAQYEQDKTQELYAPRIYGLNQAHKHLPEMQTVCGLAHKPVFCPIVDDYYKGMATTVTLAASAPAVWQALSAHYERAALIHVAELGSHPAMLSANRYAGRDDLEIVVCGNEERCTVTALFDNLGKGASGAAVQNMNLMLGFDETTGLNI